MTAPYIKDKFDFGILRTDASKVGMMLRKDNRAVPSYQVFDDEYLAQQYFTGVAGYGNLPPEKELALRQDDWRAGFGQEYMDDEKRYFSSVGMDMRFKGMGLAGPISTGIALISTGVTNEPVISNRGAESGTTGWTGPMTQSSTQAHAGTYSLKLNCTGTDTKEAYYTVSWQAEYQSKEFTFTAWVYNEAADISGARIGINDGVSNTYCAYNTTLTTWTKLTVTKTLAANATRIWLYIERTLDGAGNTSSYFDDASLLITVGVDGKLVAKAEFNDLLYVANGSFLSKLNGTGDGLTAVKTYGRKITALEVFSVSKVDYLFIALGNDSNEDAYEYMTTAEAFTTSTATVKAFKYFVNVNAATPVMWGSDSVNTVRSTVNPLNGGTAWSGQTVVATSYDEITKLMTDSGALYIMKEDIPYYLNSAGAVQNDLAPELGVLAKSTDNGKNATVWLGKIYLPWGSQSLIEYDAGVNTWRNPADFCQNLSTFNGQVFAVAGDDRYLFAILDNSTKVEILVGRDEIISGTTSWVWHPINETTLTGCETAWVSSVYQKRLWFSSTLGTESLFYIPLPTGYGDVTTDANRSFLTGTTMETSWLHGNFKDTTKGFPKLTVTMGHTYDADIYFTVKYKKLGDSAWTSIGNYTGSATSMTQSRFIPVDASSNNPKSTMFKLQFTAVTDDTTKTPVLLSYNLQGILYPTQREIIACKVYCANEIQLKDGTIDKGSYDTIIATLDEARAATFPITIYDPEGNTLTVKLLPIGNAPKWVYISNEKERKFEREYSLLMEKVALS